MPVKAISHYRIIRELGAGGMGEVFLAEDSHLRRKIALKILPESIALDKERLRRFEQEAFTASALNHPNILTIYEFGEENNVHFIASEFVDGETLRKRLNNDGVSVKEAVDIGEQIAAALAAAHSAGVVHRDIKPENIMLREDRLVKVLDFGLAKLIEKKEISPDTKAETRPWVKTNPGVVMGTVAYMSPEQARGKDVDARTDVWSLGCVLYEMVSGRFPFAGETVSDVMASILKTEPPLLSQYVSDVPHDLEKIVGKALRKNIDERYQNVKDLQIDLKDLRKELDFEAKLERSFAPNRNRVQTSDENREMQILESETIADATSAVAAKDTARSRPLSSAEYDVDGITRHKGGFVAALSILLLSAIGLGWWFYSNRSSSPDPKRIDSIAVLPFQNASAGGDAEYLSDGISEALINSLTELQQLKVIARSTAFRYKGQEVDPQVVGRALRVRAVLLGRVREVGDNLTIQVDLIDVSTGAQLWGEEYVRRVSDVLAVKQAIAREVTQKLRLKLSGEQQQQLVKRDTTNAEAYQFYLRGRYYWNKRTLENMNKAIALFQQAIDKDPNYALAYVGLADSYFLLKSDTNNSEDKLIQKAKDYALRALQIDDSLAEAHTTLAGVSDALWEWDEARRGFERAIELNPNYPTARHWYSMHLGELGRADEALREIKLAQELDPLSRVIGATVAIIYLRKGDVAAVIEQAGKVIELDPDYYLAHSALGEAYLKQGRHQEALAELEKGAALSGRDSQLLGRLGYGYAVSGRRSGALAVLRELEGKYRRKDAGGTDLAAVYVGLGEKDQALAWLEKDFQDRQRRSLIEIRIFWGFDALLGEPRYTDLLRRMGLQP